VIALVRRARSRPAKRTGLGAGGLAVGGLVLLSIGGAASPASTPSTDQAADTTTTSPTPAAPTPSAPATTATPTPVTTTALATATPPPPAPPATAAVTTTAPTPRPTRTAPITAAAAAANPAATGPAAAALAALAVKGRAPKTGYSREAFGPAWADVDGNGCDTRDDVLRRDLTAITTTVGTGGCEVAAGVLADPYSGTRIAFTRGVDTSADVQIDHVVALSNAWQTGASAWTPDTREAFANDPLNLLAVSGPLNEAKGDGDAATWLPPNKTVRCAYVARQVAVKTTYHLWVTPPEQAAARRVLSGCPGQGLPAPGATATGQLNPAAPVDAPAPAARSSAPAPATPSPAPPAGGVHYRSCAAVRAAGKGPLHRGQPGYRSALDGDGDGVACETSSSGGSGGGSTGGGSGPSGSVSYKNCAAVRAAGKAPLHRGDPGYSRKLDRDGDGVACET